MKKITLERATEIADKIKKKYKFGKSTCPEWFRNAVPFMEQDGSYNVSICVLSGKKMPQEDVDIFLQPFEGARITTRILTLPTYTKEVIKPEEKNVKKKKRRVNR